METLKNQIQHLTSADFKQLVFNYEVDKEWKYKGTLPAIIDFYADWCGPCKTVSPILEELALENSGKIVVYKVNTEDEHELASVFGISSIPTILFVPMEGQPQGSLGAMPKQKFEKIIQEVLLKNQSSAERNN
jgi:thioredoxin 1